MNISEIMGIEGDKIILQDIFSFSGEDERDADGKIQGEFINHGLLVRSAVMKNAALFNLSKELKQIFNMS